jgi:hypothetical protein
MSTRESLKKIKVDALRKLAGDIGIDTSGQKKAEIISAIVTQQVPVEVLTPVTHQPVQYNTIGIAPFSFSDTNTSFPPFNKVVYKAVLQPKELPNISFSSIYNFLIARERSGGSTVQNYKGLDRAVNHFDAGDVRNIRVIHVSV